MDLAALVPSISCQFIFGGRLWNRVTENAGQYCGQCGWIVVEPAVRRRRGFRSPRVVDRELV